MKHNNGKKKPKCYFGNQRPGPANRKGSPSIQELFAAASHYREKGLLLNAEQICQEILQREPDNPSANHLLGLIAYQAGNKELTIQLISKAIEKKPDEIPYYFDLALSFYVQGRLEETSVVFRKALGIKPDNAQIHYNLGNVLKEMGKLEDALQSYTAAARLKPDLAEAHDNLGTALMELGKTDEAIKAYQTALNVKPNFAEAYNNLGNAFVKQGKIDEALISYRNALTVKPDFAEAYNNLGNAFAELGEMDDAASSYETALNVRPDFVEAHQNLGNIFMEIGEVDKAALSYQRVLDITPGNSGVHNCLGIALKEQGRMAEAILSFQKAILSKPDFAEACNNLGNVLAGLGRMDEASANYRRALAISPGYFKAHSNLLLSMNYFPDISLESLHKEHLEWDTRHAQRLEVISRAEESDARKTDILERPLRIGYVSPDFRKHPVGIFILPVMMAHHRDAVEIFCYSQTKQPDELTERIKKSADHWRIILGQGDRETAFQIHDDSIDILVDLAGHTAGNRLLIFAFRPSPIQVTWLGYVNTTGMQAMDYRMTDAIADPEGESDKYHSEDLVRLKNGFFCYNPPEETPDVGELPARANGQITFGSFNRLNKINEEVVAVWSKILEQVPHSRLILKNRPLSDTPTRKHFEALFAQNGIAPDRLILESHSSSFWEYMGKYNEIDISLDTFPHNGHTVSCEALWMGVPIISLCGNRYASRMGASLLKRIGLPELVTTSKEEYAEKAVELARDIDRLARLRAALRQRFKESPLYDAESFAYSLEAVFREMVVKKMHRST